VNTVKKYVLPLLLLITSQAIADTRYVSDELVITLRTGPSTQHQILKTLRSGTSLEVFESSNENGGNYSRVRTAGGTEGWVLTRYLTDTPIARDRLQSALQEVDRLKEQNSTLQSRLAELKTEKDTILQERDRLGEQLKSIDGELTAIRRVADQPLKIDKENRRLLSRVTTLDNELALLKNENEMLRDHSQRDWFITGAGVVVGSMLLGIILTRIRWRKRSSGWSDSL
jgi:SH3 domain protein